METCLNQLTSRRSKPHGALNTRNGGVGCGGNSTGRGVSPESGPDTSQDQVVGDWRKKGAERVMSRGDSGVEMETAAGPRVVGS